MGKFIQSLISGDEGAADSLVFIGLVAGLAFVGISIYIAIKDPSLFSPTTYATSYGVLVGAGAGSKTLRDKMAPSGGQSQ